MEGIETKDMGCKLWLQRLSLGQTIVDTTGSEVSDKFSVRNLSVNAEF